ncbi:uncharacterized protein LOC142357042 [Convolutriloba macropyga]|uniref:uncharacterized protein LOC142357042 n=1 Tax=Convolutriloba macropyga TaxID=536237 RepID=UPI003F526094
MDIVKVIVAVNILLMTVECKTLRIKFETAFHRDAGTARKIQIRFNDAKNLNGEPEQEPIFNPRIYPGTNMTFYINPTSIKPEDSVKKITISFIRTTFVITDNWRLSRVWIEDYWKQESVFFECFCEVLDKVTPELINSCDGNA